MIRSRLAVRAAWAIVMSCLTIGSSSVLRAAAAADETVLVTASRVDESVDDALASVTVIDRAAIARSQARTLDEVLAGVEGVNVAKLGGVGQPISLFMRGGNSGHTLWLVDGVRIGSVTAGIPALQDLPLDNIERIEIVRGPRSSLYGPDAMSGIVQIFTRRGASATPSLRLTTGSNGTRQAAGAFGVGDEHAWVDVQVTHLATDGTNACLGAPFPPGGGCFTFEPDRDPYRNTSYNMRVGGEVGAGTRLEGFAQRATAHVAFDSSVLNESSLRNEVAGLRANGTWIDGIESTVNVGRAVDRSTSFRVGSNSTSRFDSLRDSASWQNVFSATGGRWVAGIDWLRDRVVSSTAFTVAARRNQAAFLQYAAAQGAASVSLSARLDDNQQFGSHSTGSLGLGWRAASGLHWYASVANAFRAPTFNDLYYPLFGNPKLSPERAVTTEVGAKQQLPWGRWSLSTYRSSVDDLVAFDTVTYLPKNIARAKLTGADGHLEWRTGAWRLQQSVAWLEAIDRSVGATRVRELPRRPRWSGRSTVGWGNADFDLAAALTFAGARYDDLANRTRLGAYGTLDLTAAYRATPAVELQFRLANALDHRYESASLYPATGREAFFTVRYLGAR